MSSVRIKSLVNQKLSKQIKSMIIDEFWLNYFEWKTNQKNISGKYTIEVCEQIELTDRFFDDSISLPVELYSNYQMQDCGYMQVYGIREIPNTLSFGEIQEMENIHRCIKIGLY